MPHLFVRPEDITGDMVKVTGKEAHHWIRVLRKKPGDEVRLFNGLGSGFRARITAAGKNEVNARIIEKLPDNRRVKNLRLFLGASKGAKMDFVLGKAVELGISDFFPVLMKRSVRGFGTEGMQNRMSRWKRIALSSSKQCGRSVIPGIHEPVTLRDFPGLVSGGDITLVPWEKEKDVLLNDAMNNCRANIPAAGGINLIIGPEGGMEKDEVSLLRNAGGITVGLGRNILRTETASLYVLSVLVYEFGACCR